MTAERDDEPRDELLRRVVAELRRPVRLDPACDAAALRTIRGLKRRRWVPLLATGALAAGLALAALFHPLGLFPRSSTRPVVLRLLSPASTRVVVVGDFNDWDPSGTPLTPAGDPGVWSVELRLKPGRYHYAFLLDGRRWIRDPSQPPVVASDFGAPMSVLTVS